MKILLAVLPALLPLLLTASFAALTWVGVRAAQLINSKTSNLRLRNAFVVLEDLVSAVVHDVEAVEKPRLLELGTGTLTLEQAQTLKDLALKRVKQTLGEKGLDTLKKLVGALIGGDVDAFLSGKVEQAVANLGEPEVVVGQPSPR